MDESEQLTRQAIVEAAKELNRRYRVTWGLTPLNPGQTPGPNLVFLTARALWGLGSALAVADPELPWEGSETSLFQLGERELAELLSLRTTGSTEDTCAWFSSDTAPFEPVKTTGAVVLALLAWLQADGCKGNLNREVADEAAVAISGAARWLCETVNLTDEAQWDAVSTQAAYCVRPTKGWPTIPRSLHEELFLVGHRTSSRYEAAVRRMMSDAVLQELRGRPLAWQLAFDCRATKDALLALAFFMHAARNAPLSRKLADRPLALDTVEQAILGGCDGLVSSAGRRGWSDVVCDNGFAVLALLLCVPAIRTNQARKREIVRTSLEQLDGIPIERVLDLGDACSLNGYLWSRHLLGEVPGGTLSALYHWLKTGRGRDTAALPRGFDPRRPDSLGWLCTALSHTLCAACANTRKQIASFSAAPADSQAPVPFLARIIAYSITASLAGLLIAAICCGAVLLAPSNQTTIVTALVTLFAGAGGVTLLVYRLPERLARSLASHRRRRSPR
jgi:hypothetical protein